MIPTICHSGKGKIMDNIKRSGIARDWKSEGKMNKKSKKEVKAVKLFRMILPWWIDVILHLS